MNINKDVKTIRKELFKHIESVQEEYISKGWLPRRMNLNNGVIRGLLEIFIWGLFQLYTVLQFVMEQATPNKATKEWLDMHAKNVDLERKTAKKATGNVILTRKSTFDGHIKIPAGKIIRTPADAEGKRYRYIITAETILSAGNISVSVPVIAEEYGSSSNVTAGLIREIVTPIENIASVANAADWLTSEGTDIESDTALLERYVLQWRAMAGVTSAAYALAALSVDGVASVKVFDQHPRGQGTIDIVILGTGGAPTEQLIANVSAAVAAKIIINDDVLVKKVETVLVTLKAIVEHTSGNASNIAAIAEAGIRSKVDIVSKTIGKDLILPALISDFINMPEVKRVVWQSPADDLEINNNQVVQITGVEVTTRLVADE